MNTEHTNAADTQSVIGNRAMEIIVAAALLLFGATIAWASYQLGAGWASDGPQAGYFPFYIGTIIALSSLITLVQAMLGRATTNGTTCEWTLGTSPRCGHFTSALHQRW